MGYIVCTIRNILLVCDKLYRKHMMAMPRILNIYMILICTSLDEHMYCFIVSVHFGSIFDRIVSDALIERRILQLMRFIVTYCIVQ